MKLEPGEILSGTLRLSRKIADGGMGSVWIAEHLVLGTEVAVKVVSGPWAAVPSARTRFLREARMTAKIASPHVVRVLDCRLTDADEPYLVLELLHGETLEHRVRTQGVLSVFELAEIVSQACEALAASHAAGIVHRDLKPENVFLVAGANTFVKLIDFGVAKPTRRDDCIDVDRLPAGTPQYMSPEHLFDPETTDERSDLFSLAAVAYFALTRRSPFEADSLEGLYFAIDGGAFERPSARRPELPPSLDAWFETALANDPARRFQDARAMAGALHDAVREARDGRTTQIPSAPIACAAGASTAEPASPVDDGPTPSPTELLRALRASARSARRASGARRARLRSAAVAAVSLASAAVLLLWRGGLDLTAAVASEQTAASAAPPLEAAALVVREPARAAPRVRARTSTRPPARPAAPPSSCEAPPAAEDGSGAIHDILGSVPNPSVAP